MSKNTNLSFLTDFLTADIVNSRVGMNNVSPQATFDVTGTGKFSGILTLGSTVSNGTYTYTLPSATGTLALVGGSGVGTVTSVAAITLGTSGTDLTSTVANGTTTPVITLNVPDASVTARGVITTGTQYIAGLKIFTSTIVANVDLQLPAAGTASTTFIKNISGSGLTSIGSNGFGFNNSDNIYFSGSNKAGGVFAFNNTGNRTYTLQDASGTLAFTSEIPTNAVGGTGTLNTIPKFTAATTIGNSNIFDSGSIIYNTNPAAGTFAWQFNGSTVTGQSYGAQVIAGTNASDIGFKVMNAAASINYLVVRGDGLVTLTGALNGTSAVFSSTVSSTQYTATSTGGSGLRVYGGSGTNQWDMYLNGANIRFSDNTGTGSFVVDRPATFSSSVQTGGDISLMNSSGDINLKMKDSSGNADRVLTRQSTTNDIFIGDVDANGGKTTIRANGENYLTVTSGGNVLIGTTTDAGYKLDVNGSGRFIGNLEFGSMTIFNGNALGTRTVTTSPVTLQTTSQFGGGNTGNLTLVSGIIQGNGGIGFIDIVLWMYGGSTPTVISSQTTGGPAGRTYSISASANLQLTMASGTYFVSSNTFRQSYTN